MIKKVLLLMITLTVLISAQSSSGVIYLYGGGVTGAVATQPDAVSNLISWWRPAGISTLEWTDSQVSAGDWSATGNFIVGTVNGLNTCKTVGASYGYAAGNIALNIGIAKDATIFLAVNMTDGTAADVFSLSGGSGANTVWVLQIIAGGTMKSFIRDVSANTMLPYPTVNFLNQGWKIIVLTLDRTNKKGQFIVDGEVATASNASFTNQAYDGGWAGNNLYSDGLGSAFPLGFESTEMVHYDRVLTSAEINGVGLWIATEIGATWTDIP